MVLLGIHFQTSHILRQSLFAVWGAIWDVVVDLRPNSLTYAQWFGAVLSEKKYNDVLQGIWARFFKFEPNSEIIYFVSKPYAPDYERTLLWNDPIVNINWPFEPSVLSPKDQSALSLGEIKEATPYEY